MQQPKTWSMPKIRQNTNDWRNNSVKRYMKGPEFKSKVSNVCVFFFFCDNGWLGVDLSSECKIILASKLESSGTDKKIQG